MRIPPSTLVAAGVACIPLHIALYGPDLAVGGWIAAVVGMIGWYRLKANKLLQVAIGAGVVAGVLNFGAAVAEGVAHSHHHLPAREVFAALVYFRVGVSGIALALLGRYLMGLGSAWNVRSVVGGLFRAAFTAGLIVGFLGICIGYEIEHVVHGGYIQPRGVSILSLAAHVVTIALYVGAACSAVGVILLRREATIE